MNFEKYIDFFVIYFHAAPTNNFPFWTSFDMTFEMIRFFENMIKVCQYPNNNNNNNNNNKVILKNASTILARVKKWFHFFKMCILCSREQRMREKKLKIFFKQNSTRSCFFRISRIYFSNQTLNITYFAGNDAID